MSDERKLISDVLLNTLHTFPSSLIHLLMTYFCSILEGSYSVHFPITYSSLHRPNRFLTSFTNPLNQDENYLLINSHATIEIFSLEGAKINSLEPSALPLASTALPPPIQQVTPSREHLARRQHTDRQQADRPRIIVKSAEPSIIQMEYLSSLSRLYLLYEQKIKIIDLKQSSLNLSASAAASGETTSSSHQIIYQWDLPKIRVPKLIVHGHSLKIDVPLSSPLTTTTTTTTPSSTTSPTTPLSSTEVTTTITTPMENDDSPLIYFTLIGINNIFVYTQEGKKMKEIESNIPLPAFSGAQPKTKTFHEEEEIPLGIFHQPAGMAFDENYLYVCDQGYNRIQIIEKKSGQSIKQFGRFSKEDKDNFLSKNTKMKECPSLNQPQNILLYEDYLYVGDCSRISIWDKNGIWIGWIGTGEIKEGRKKGEFKQIDSMCIINSKMYVLDLGNARVQVFR